MLVGEKGTSHFARMFTPLREKPGQDVGSLATEDLAQVSELPDCDRTWPGKEISILDSAKKSARSSTKATSM